MFKPVLMIAFHFPPFSGSSGVQRTLRFSQYLPDNQWQPIVLTAHERVHQTCSKKMSVDSDKVVVKRAFALDTAKHLSFKGRYPDAMAIPDRWVSWVLGAVPSGLSLIRKYKPRVIWSTYPIASAHYIGWLLHRFSGIPWVADFRDPMVEQDEKTLKWTPANKAIRNARLWIERRAVRHAQRLVFCTQGARQICMQRYPDADHSRWIVLSNGYDEGEFKKVESSVGGVTSNQKVRLLHSGVLYYTADRDPTCFLEAVAQMKKAGQVEGGKHEIVFRASGSEVEYQRIIEEKDIADIVSLQPSIDYDEALKEMMSMDGLLIFQGYTSNPAIPAKVYEYLRARRPILSLADENGDTARLMATLGMDYIAPLDQVEAIKEQLKRFLSDIQLKTVKKVSNEKIRTFSRELLTKELASLLDEVTDNR